MDEQTQQQDKVSAEYLLGQTKLAQRVPEEVQEEIRAVLRRPVRERIPVRQLWKDLRMKERFGVGEHMFRHYARQVVSVDSGVACGWVIQGIAELLSVPIESGEQLEQRGQALVLARLAHMLQEQQLPPEQVVKVADVMAKGQVAAVKAAAQRLAERKDARVAQEARRAAKRKEESGDNMTLEERVKRIYGIEMPEFDASGRQTNPPPEEEAPEDLVWTEEKGWGPRAGF